MLPKIQDNLNFIIFNNDSYFINVDSLKISTVYKQLGSFLNFNDEYNISFEINNIHKYINKDSTFIFKYNGFKSIYVTDNKLTPIYKLSSIKNNDIVFDVNINDIEIRKCILGLGDELTINNLLNHNYINIKVSSSLNISLNQVPYNDSDIILLKTILISNI